MDCGLVHCVGSLRPLKQKSPKKFGSQKYGEMYDEPDRIWPVAPDEYEFLHQAGKGASAVVCCARCKPLEEIVAIKKLDLDARCNYDLSALTREATMMKKLQHPNVLPLYTSFVVRRELWMVMPYMAHGSLRSIMKREHLKEGLEEVIIATIMRCVLEGLDYLHQNGGIHRDVKADNILLSATGEVCLADFGVAAARARPVSMINLDMVTTMATTFVGTPCWMAPEVMSQEDGYNTSADIWSFGITMIELATGRPPLARAHPMRVILDTINNPAPSLDDYPQGQVYSKCMKEVVDACLNKNSFERPSASDLLNFRFFKMARDQDFLEKHFLAGLKPPRELPVAMIAAAGLSTSAGALERQHHEPELLGGFLFSKPAMGLQDLALGRIMSRIKSNCSWHFPGAQSVANMAQQNYRASDESLSTHDEKEAEQSITAAGLREAGLATGENKIQQQGEDAAEALAAAIVSRTSSAMGSFTAGNLLPLPTGRPNCTQYDAIMPLSLSPSLGLQKWNACNWTTQQQLTTMQAASTSTEFQSCLQEKLQRDTSTQQVKPAELPAEQHSKLLQQHALNLAQQIETDVSAGHNAHQQQHEHSLVQQMQADVSAEQDEHQQRQQQQQQEEGGVSIAAVNCLDGQAEQCYVEVEVVLSRMQAGNKQHMQQGAGATVSSDC